MGACAHGLALCARMLLDRGVDVHVAKSTGWTSFMEACQRGSENCVRLLLERHADITNTKEDGALYQNETLTTTCLTCMIYLYESGPHLPMRLQDNRLHFIHDKIIVFLYLYHKPTTKVHLIRNLKYPHPRKSYHHESAKHISQSTNYFLRISGMGHASSICH